MTGKQADLQHAWHSSSHPIGTQKRYVPLKERAVQVPQPQKCKEAVVTKCQHYARGSHSFLNPLCMMKKVL